MVSGIIPLHLVKDDYIEEVYEMLSKEWPSIIRPARMAFLNRSGDNLPTCFIELVDGVVIGHARLKYLEVMPRSAYIESVVIDPKYRGKGYGKMLMQKVEDHARDMDFEEMYLITYDQKGFYERLGYQVCPHFPLHGKPSELWLPDSQKVMNNPDYIRITNEIKQLKEKSQRTDDKKDSLQMDGSSETSADETTKISTKMTKSDSSSLPAPPPPPPKKAIVKAPNLIPKKIKKGVAPSMVQLLSNLIQHDWNLEESEQCLPKISMRKEL